MKPGSVFLYSGSEKTLFAQRDGKVVFSDGDNMARFDFDNLELIPIAERHRVYLSPTIVSKFEKLGMVLVREIDELDLGECLWVEMSIGTGFFELKIVAEIKNFGAVGFGYRCIGEEKFLAPKYLKMYRTNSMTPS